MSDYLLVTVLETVTSNSSPYAMGPLSCLTVTLVYCGQAVGWIKIPLGMEVGLSPGDICARWGPNSPHGKGHSSPHFSAHVYCGQTVAHLSSCWALVFNSANCMVR